MTCRPMMALAFVLACAGGARAADFGPFTLGPRSEAAASGAARRGDDPDSRPARVRQQALQVPVTDADGETVELAARVCRPAGDAPARLVVINHGSPANASDRPGMRLTSCTSEAASWFLDRGYVVGFVLRRGYGATGGDWAETFGSCAHADYGRAGLETARDIDAAVTAMTALPFVRPTGAIVVGQSAGGWGTIAYDSRPHPKVAAFVVMAGGRGGYQNGHPNENCHPELLAEAAGRYGARATTPMLWIYAANDHFFGPPVARALYNAFTAAGGQAELVQPGPFGRDGHGLFFGADGSDVWGPPVERYLARMNVPAR